MGHVNKLLINMGTGSAVIPIASDIIAGELRKHQNVKHSIV